MSTTNPIRPGEKEELDEETIRILNERDATFEQDKLSAVDARQALKEIRANLKHSAPR
jgi:hypothetical protein